MQVLFFRLITILAIFFLGAFVAGLTSENYSAIPIWFIAVTVWTLLLGFRRALWTVLPFLLLADILWDGNVGELFLGGFLLATVATYLIVRIETHSELMQWGVYSILVSILSSLVVVASIMWPDLWITSSSLLLYGKVLFWQSLITLIFYLPMYRGIQKVEKFLDTSYKDQSKKIR